MKAIALPTTAAAWQPASSALITTAAAIQQAAAAAQDHQAALTEEHLLMLGISKLQPLWSQLPLGPYPATADAPNAPPPGFCPSGTYANPVGQGFNCVVGTAPAAVEFPRTGDPGFVLLSANTITAQQRAEPAAVAQGLVDQAAARTPKLSGMFWLGLACLGLGVYVLKKK